ncbi:30S ribosomal protein S4, partial [bacterium]|nr:30S ribosomal protein S4 [bacterium]
GKFNKKHTSYEVQLREKQKVRKMYGVLERQFRRYYGLASKITGNTGTTLLQLLESRLDNIVYRMGFTFSRNQARMWVTHAHFLVNSKAVNIPSYVVQPGDVISLKESSSVKGVVKDIMETTGSRDKSPWLDVDRENLKGKYLAVPDRSQIDPKIQESLIIEFYSR